MRALACCLPVILSLAACSTDPSSESSESSEASASTQTSADSESEAESSDVESSEASESSESNGDGDGDAESSGDGDGDGAPLECDYGVGSDGILLFEAEDLNFADDWMSANTLPDAYGSGYIFWSGQSFNNAPGNGLIEVELGVTEPGRYRVQWRNQIGMGTDPTEHNDVWLRFPNADDAYGKAGDMPETRRYPKPICDDAAFIAGIEALPEVSEATCAAGSTSDGWMKVYSSGATMWRWSTRTSDSDAHDIYVEFDQPGAYTMQLSARADYLLLDRVVVHREDVDNALAQAAEHATTPCD